jgi:hypothetical protein
VTAPRTATGHEVDDDADVQALVKGSCLVLVIE